MSLSTPLAWFSVRRFFYPPIGYLCDPVTDVTRYKVTHASEQVARWNFQNNATRTSPPGPAFVLEVPLRNLLTGMCDFVPCDRIRQRIYFELDSV